MSGDVGEIFPVEAASQSQWVLPGKADESACIIHLNNAY
jgi:hypothetical protein